MTRCCSILAGVTTGSRAAERKGKVGGGCCKGGPPTVATTGVVVAGHGSWQLVVQTEAWPLRHWQVTALAKSLTKCGSAFGQGQRTSYATGRETPNAGVEASVERPSCSALQHVGRWQSLGCGILYDATSVGSEEAVEKS